MASVSFPAVIGVKLNDGHYTVTEPTAASRGALAALVADSATATGIGAGDASVPVAAIAVDITALTAPSINVIVDTTAVTTMNQLKALLNAVLQSARSSGKFPG